MLDICNAALLKIGEKPMTSLTEQSPAATLSNALFSAAAAGILSLYPWKFATQKFDLNKIENEFILPENVLRVVAVCGTDKYEIAGKKIICNAADKISVLAITDPGAENYPYYFSNLLTIKLSEEFCIPLCDNQSMQSAVQGQFERELTRAKFTDGGGAQPSAPNNFSLINERF